MRLLVKTVQNRHPPLITAAPESNLARHARHDNFHFHLRSPPFFGQRLHPGAGQTAGKVIEILLSPRIVFLEYQAYPFTRRAKGWLFGRWVVVQETSPDQCVELALAMPRPSLPFMPGMGYVGYMNRIQVSPEIHFGKPCVAGTRIPVQAVLELVREAIPFEAIIRDYYPDLKMEDIQACVQYAIDVVQTGDIHVGVPS